MKFDLQSQLKQVMADIKAIDYTFIFMQITPFFFWVFYLESQGPMSREVKIGYFKNKYT